MGCFTRGNSAERTFWCHRQGAQGRDASRPEARASP